jgi:hypothetical protein
VADSGVFDWVCEQLEQRSELNRLEARGTVRLALREAGLESRSVTGSQLAVVLEKLLPKELSSRSIRDADALCRGLKEDALSRFDDAGSTTEQPEDVFARLGGDS